jgi:hypothetical protein
MSAETGQNSKVTSLSAKVFQIPSDSKSGVNIDAKRLTLESRDEAG